MNCLPTPRVAVAHLGSRWNYDMPVILEALGLLTRFYTDAYCGEGSWLAPLRWLPPVLTNASVQRLQSRVRYELPADKVKAFNLLGLEYGLRYSRVRDSEARLRLFLEINQRFNRLVWAQGFPSGTNVIFSMNTASLELFEHYRTTGFKRLMDQTLVPMRVESAVLAAEYDRWSGWATDNYQDWRLAPIFQQWVEREEREWELADLILCASPTTVAALKSCGVPDRKCMVIPYPVSANAFALNRVPAHGRPLRLLFVGQVNLRKGVPYFLEMLKRLRPGSFEARIVGPIQLKSEVLARYSDLCTFTNAVPRAQMPSHYAWADVFVFPSLCDSAPGATNEALAAGLPVITTPGAGTVIENGVEGWIVPDRDVEALAARVEQLDADRELLAQLSCNAALKAQKIDVAYYGKQLQQACEHLLGKSI